MNGKQAKKLRKKLKKLKIEKDKTFLYETDKLKKIIDLNEETKKFEFKEIPVTELFNFYKREFKKMRKKND